MIKKVLTIFVVMIVLLSVRVNGFYSYEKKFTLFKLNRNKIKANYSISYDKTTLTNEDIEMNIAFDKIISIIGDGNNAVVSDDGKTITKTIESNEKNKILIRDEDFNYQEVEYHVDWIDKNPPIITGAEQGKTYNSNVHLEFSDESEITEIYADYYSDSFSIYTGSENFWENERLQMVPATRNSITIYVTNNKKEMEKYNYYMDGVLYATTNKKKYTFTGLELSDTKHHFVVEALDRYGNVLESRETYRNTIPIDRVRFGATDDVEYIAIDGIPETVSDVTVYTWVDGHYEETLQTPYVYYDSDTSVLIALEMKKHKNYTGKYIVYFLINYIGEDGLIKRLDCIGNIMMPSKFSHLYYAGLPNDFTGNSNYYVRCIDAAGNESELNFVLQK